MAKVMAPIFGEIMIPRWVTDLPSFRRWVHSGVLPEKLAVHFLNGDVWVDFHTEELHTHSLVKAALYRTLVAIVHDEHLGLFMPDGMLVTNEVAGIGTEPDGMFVSFESLDTGRARFTAGKTREGQATELVGTPDLVIEVVSPSSEDKDTEWLMTAYHNAGIPEYWLVDARPEPLRFDILRRTAKGYSAARKHDGWAKSPVLARSFRLVRGEGKRGYPVFRLETR